MRLHPTPTVAVAAAASPTVAVAAAASPTVAIAAAASPTVAIAAAASSARPAAPTPSLLAKTKATTRAHTALAAGKPIRATTAATLWLHQVHRLEREAILPVHGLDRLGGRLQRVKAHLRRPPAGDTDACHRDPDPILNQLLHHDLIAVLEAGDKNVRHAAHQLVRGLVPSQHAIRRHAARGKNHVARGCPR